MTATHEQWLQARAELLAAEKELTRHREEVARKRRAMPWRRIERDYAFEGPNGSVPLTRLFNNRGQLIVYHFMFAPEWEEGCRSCSLLADHFDGMLPHLAHRDVSFAAISRAPHARLAAFQQRMGWRFPWLSANGNSFPQDFGVHFTREEIAAGPIHYNYQPGPGFLEDLPGLSVFAKDADGQIFHTYSTYARGLDPLMGVYQFLDLVPKGRDEEGLAFSMAWVRHHDRYDSLYTLDPKAGYQKPQETTSNCCQASKTA